MANLFYDLPVPSANGDGAAVDVSKLGTPKTVTLQGDLVGTVNIKVSQNGAGGPWATVASLSPGKNALDLDVAAEYMRASVSGYVQGSGNCDVGGNDDGALFAALDVPAGDGTGASSDVSGHGCLKTFVVGGGAWSGTVAIEVSQDGVDWAQVLFFTDEGEKTIRLTTQYMRVRRAGVTAAPGLPVVTLGSINEPFINELTEATWSVAKAQAALDDTGVLKLGPGTFDLGATSLNVNGYFLIEGSGMERTKLTYSGAGEAIVFNSDSSATTVGKISDLSLEGPGSATGTTGMRIGRSAGSPLSASVFADNCRVRKFGEGIQLGSAQICRFRNCYIQSNDIGVSTRDDIGSTQCDFYGCAFTVNRIGIYLKRLLGSNFYGCDVESNTEEGILVENPDNTTRIQGIFFYGTWIENNNTSRQGTGVGEIRVQNAAGATATTRNVHLVNTYWTTINAADYHIYYGANEQVFRYNDQFATPLQLGYEAGTPPRIGTPGRQPGRFFGPGTAATDFIRVYDVPDQDVSPDAYRGDILRINNTVATTIVSLENFVMEDGELVRLWILDGNTTLQHNSGSNKDINLAGAVDYSPPANTMVTLVLYGGQYYEISRNSTG